MKYFTERNSINKTRENGYGKGISSECQKTSFMK